ncbi:hypothetical protein [Caballeronia sp. Lep1P3]|uniref:hypothetical protein n=1 Tax=Caballeronia sp. Lep1P3 TaxID=2878150 RepID=UPI001FD462D6|nr:hypothetical protein [Caballeronia sp. Lep1P3]
MIALNAAAHAVRVVDDARPSLSARRAQQNSAAAIAGIVRDRVHCENADLRRIGPEISENAVKRRMHVPARRRLRFVC